MASDTPTGPKKLGRYDLLRVLGKGAMGTVYEGRDPNLDRRVAIKTIKVESLTAEEAAEYELRFRTEARSVARLQHPNIVSVYDSDRDGDTAFLVMEFIQGRDLKQHLDKGEVYSLEQTLSIMRDLLAALDYAHRQSIVHRDIKPANLLMEPGGRVKLTDFGVARIQDSGDATRTQGSMVGTLKYMSPEQVQGQAIDARTDILAAGVLLYQLLTSKRPFDGGSDFDIIQQIVSKPHADPSSINAQLPVAIDTVVARALAKAREQRFATAADFSAALAEAVNSADDTTVVPPAGLHSGRNSTWGSAITQAPSGASVSGSTVTQEVELVYWKDIKESEDIEDFEGFLARFPTGIYADLARRRLKKLKALAGDGSSAGSGTVLVTRASSAAQEPTRAWPATRPAELGAASTDDEATRALTRPAPIAPIPSDLAPLTSATPPAEPPAATPTGSSKRPLLIGLVLLVGAAIGYALLPGKSSSPPEDAAAQAMAAAAPASAGSAAAPAESAASAAAASAPAPASAAKAVATKKSDKPASAPAAVPKPAPSASVVATPAATSSNKSAARAPASEAKTHDNKDQDPSKACEGRWFISLQLCLSEQCNKPAFKNTKFCEDRRAMEQRNLDLPR